MPGQTTESTGLIIACLPCSNFIDCVHVFPCTGSGWSCCDGAVTVEQETADKRGQYSLIILCHNVGYYECDCCV